MFVLETFPVYYIAKNYRTGAMIVNLLVRKPDNTNEGLFGLVEFDSLNHKGVYKYDYLPLLEGEYLFTIFENGIHKYSKTEYFKTRQELRPIVRFD